MKKMSKPKNRNPIKTWEITFPKSGSVSRESFVNSFPPCVGYICALECHKDGSAHLHLGLKLKKPLSHSKLKDWIESTWPNDWKRIHFTPIRNWGNWEDYCKKEDPNYIQQIEETKRVKSMRDHESEIMQELVDTCEIQGQLKKLKYIRDEWAEQQLINGEGVEWENYWREMNVIE